MSDLFVPSTVVASGRAFRGHNLVPSYCILTNCAANTYSPDIPLTWTYTGDTPPSGVPYRPTIGKFTPLSDGSRWTGIRCDEGGTIHASLQASWVTVVSSGVSTMTLELRRSGVVVGSASYSKTVDGLDGFTSWLTVDVPELVVLAGDVIDGWFQFDGHNAMQIIVPSAMGLVDWLELSGPLGDTAPPVVTGSVTMPHAI